MSAAQSHTTLRTKLEALECHFTWEFHSSRSKLLLIRDNLVDFDHEANQWLGHMYNLQAYIHYKLSSVDDTLGSTVEDAARCFGRATEAFRQIRNTGSDEGPWLLVNYGNMAWLHFILREEAISQSYLAKIESLLQQYPSPAEGELHSEVYAEKAWALMYFSHADKVKATEYFQKALRMEPDRVEWNTAHALALSSSVENPTPEQQAEILEKLIFAKERDPENLYLASRYLWRLAQTGRVIEEEARELAMRVLQNPIGADSGISQLLRLYRMYISPDEAIDFAGKALERHPNDRYLKRLLARCCKWKIFSDRDNLKQSLNNRAIDLYHEVICLYPHSSLLAKFDLASLYAKSIPQENARANQIYEELLDSSLEPSELQMLYNGYANYLHFNLKDRNKSISYHMRAAEISQPSRHRNNSIRVLKQIQKTGGRNRRCGDIESFLANLPE